MINLVQFEASGVVVDFLEKQSKKTGLSIEVTTATWIEQKVQEEKAIQELRGHLLNAEKSEVSDWDMKDFIKKSKASHEHA